MQLMQNVHHHHDINVRLIMHSREVFFRMNIWKIVNECVFHSLTLNFLLCVFMSSHWSFSWQIFLFVKKNVTNETLLIHFNVDDKYLLFIINYHVVQYRMTITSLFVRTTHFYVVEKNRFECYKISTSIFLLFRTYQSRIYLRFNMMNMTLW